MTTTLDALRRGVEGDLPSMAAVELLAGACGGRLIACGSPWLVAQGHDALAIDWALLLAESGVLSGSERRIALLAASLAEGEPVSLRDAVPPLDAPEVAALTGAIRIAAGIVDGR